ncbi:MAG: peptide-methionine (S)-S-oxide reductase MsrA [Burkholderiales bacterium]
MQTLAFLPLRWLGAVLFCGLTAAAGAQTPTAKPPATTPVAQAASNSSAATATFAGGCFWCVESDFDKLPGVLSTTSGYMGGSSANPSYEQVSAKGTGHAEVVQVVYDPAKVSYERLLSYFWHTIDPTTKDRQFCDSGSPYRSAIFAHGPAQLKSAQESLKALEKTKPFKEPVVTQVVPASAFYPAETDHQDYYLKNPLRYKYYRTSCGRDARLKQLWGDLAGK